MRSRRPGSAAAGGFAVLVVAVVVAPSLVFDAATARGGAARVAGTDLIVASALVGVAYAAYVLRVLRQAVRRDAATDQWLSCVLGLVSLSLTASVLPAVVLHETALLHARAADAEWPVVASWTALLVLAAVLADVVRRTSLRWLRAEHRAPSRSGSSTTAR